MCQTFFYILCVKQTNYLLSWNLTFCGYNNIFVHASLALIYLYLYNKFWVQNFNTKKIKCFERNWCIPTSCVWEHISPHTAGNINITKLFELCQKKNVVTYYFYNDFECFYFCCYWLLFCMYEIHFIPLT